MQEAAEEKKAGCRVSDGGKPREEMTSGLVDAEASLGTGQSGRGGNRRTSGR